MEEISFEIWSFSFRDRNVMPILKSEGVVLRRIKYGETSLIATLYTKHSGKISLIAKGARKPKSKFVGSLEPATHSSVIYYHKESRDIQVLSEIEIINPNLYISENLRKSAVAMAIVGLVDSVMSGTESNEDIFELLSGTLSALNDTDYDVALLWFFEINLLRLLGFGIDVHHPEGLSSGEKLKGEPLSIFEKIENVNLPDIGISGFTRGTFKKLNRFFSKYLEYHVEGVKKTKALKFVDSLI